MNTPSWTNMFVSFSSVYTTAQNGSCYSLDTTGSIYYFDSSSNSWSWISGPSSNAITSISASVDGSITVIDDSGSSYLYSYGSWSAINNSEMCVSSGDSTHYISVSMAGTITKYSNGAASVLSTGPTKVSTTTNNGQIVGIDGTGKVYQRSGNVWAVLSGKNLKQVDVSLSSSGSVQICGVDASGNGWMYNGSTWMSISKPSGISAFVSLEAGSNSIWATCADGSVYYSSF